MPLANNCRHDQYGTTSVGKMEYSNYPKKWASIEDYSRNTTADLTDLESSDAEPLKL